MSEGKIKGSTAGAVSAGTGNVPSRTREYWLNLAKSTIHGVTEANAEKMADHLIADYAARGDGSSCGSWHASAVVHGHLERCQCYPCRCDRSEVALTGLTRRHALAEPSST